MLNQKATDYDIPIVHSQIDNNTPNQLMGLTKRLIEIRNLLKSINTNSSSALTLPSIVVIGSQSSGKSSVLEAIVGHEFLPKGSNMVTRRPIELTLIHTPNSHQEYSEFPQLGLGKITSFSKVQKTLTDLNLAVSDEECVSHKPIELKIYSPNVPDLTLVDLPGYIQVVTRNQPIALKQKIIDLCDVYIQEPNIILAVCAADVDLANSEALRSSRVVDPMGLRTIGVITKMDLVEPALGVSILKNKNFPLSHGYIGVVNKSTGAKNSTAMIQNEQAYFKKHTEYDPTMVGSTTLRQKLMEVLETHMGRSLNHIVDAVEVELDDARYDFKVHFNDVRISPESYVAETMDAFKQRFKEFKKQFDKQSVKESIRLMLEQRMLDIASEQYYDDSVKLAGLPKECGDSMMWDNKVNQASAQLTRSGVGKASVQLVVDLISSKLTEITTTEAWKYHANARQQVLQLATELLRSKFHITIDQVENTIKPLKFEVDVTELEWAEGQRRAIDTLQRQLNESQQELKEIKSQIGRRKFRHGTRYINYVDNAHPDEPIPESPFPAPIITQIRQALHTQSRITILTQRLQAIKSRQCSSLASKPCCPETFLSVVSEKLATTAVMFIQIELLNEFFFQLPREVDNRMYYSLDRQQVEAFCKENPGIETHLRAQERKQTLELVMTKLRDLTRNI
ncbi:P-loop containing nucleoside triphosphate hydrolase protein [Globomyces pollinis-pini]|nr:P-loop containing nucleoside triphosphate hydrolase protein [Globomyces pollinis-pini]